MDEKREFISLLFDGYKKRKLENRLYSQNDNVPKIIIQQYIELIEKPSFKDLITSYKINYIFHESRVEQNIRKEELYGLGEVYDYIQNFDFDKNKFNIFVTSLILHQRLYSHCEIGFGGNLRETNAVFSDLDIDITPPEEAKKIFNNYIIQKDNIFEKYNQGDIFGYIEDCIKLNVELIKLQPFADGNKRTFRALTNLLLKRVNIPPIYIELNERDEYKKALVKAMKNNDYNDIIQFYYYKICDSIITLDIKNSQIHENDNDLKKQK